MDAVEWLEERIAELEEELRVLRELRELLAGRARADRESLARPRPGERSEEVKVGRKRVARLFEGEGYARLALLAEVPLPRDVREYLDTVVGEIRAQQARLGHTELAELSVAVEDGRWVSAEIRNLHNAVDTIKARAALRHAAETAYMYARSARGGANG